MPLQAGVKTVADRNIDEPVFSANRYCRLRSHVGQREKARPPAATEDESQHVVHSFTSYPLKCRKR